MLSIFPPARVGRLQAAMSSSTEAVGGTGGGAVPSAIVGGTGGGAVPSAIIGGTGGGAVPSAMVGGTGGGAVPSARIAVGNELLAPAMLANGFVPRPAKNINPKHTSRIFEKRMFSSSEDFGAGRKIDPGPSARHARSLRPTAVLPFRGERDGRYSDHKRGMCCSCSLELQ